jgi:hypothetical protein
MERRNCQEIILKMLEKVPADKVDFIKDLRWNFDDAGYKAPEETLQWERTMHTVMIHIPNPKEDWEFEVLSIFTTKSIEGLREAFKNK